MEHVYQHGCSDAYLVVVFDHVLAVFLLDVHCSNPKSVRRCTAQGTRTLSDACPTLEQPVSLFGKYTERRVTSYRSAALIGRARGEEADSRRGIPLPVGFLPARSVYTHFSRIHNGHYVLS